VCVCKCGVCCVVCGVCGGCVCVCVCVCKCGVCCVVCGVCCVVWCVVFVCVCVCVWYVLCGVCGCTSNFASNLLRVLHEVPFRKRSQYFKQCWIVFYYELTSCSVVRGTAELKNVSRKDVLLLMEASLQNREKEDYYFFLCNSIWIPGSIILSFDPLT
jgi:hypothetical protein